MRVRPFAFPAPAFACVQRQDAPYAAHIADHRPHVQGILYNSASERAWLTRFDQFVAKMDVLLKPAGIYSVRKMEYHYEAFVAESSHSSGDNVTEYTPAHWEARTLTYLRIYTAPPTAPGVTLVQTAPLVPPGGMMPPGAVAYYGQQQQPPPQQQQMAYGGGGQPYQQAYGQPPPPMQQQAYPPYGQQQPQQMYGQPQ